MDGVSLIDIIFVFSLFIPFQFSPLSSQAHFLIHGSPFSPTARSRPGLNFDYRRPSLPNAILALEMVRSAESESSSRIGSCTSLLKTLREENGLASELDGDREEIELKPAILEGGDEDRLQLGLDESYPLRTPSDPHHHSHRSPSPREAKFLRRKHQQEAYRRGSAQQQQKGNKYVQRMGWTSQTDLRALEHKYFRVEETADISKMGPAERVGGSWSYPCRIMGGGDKVADQSATDAKALSSKKRRKSAIPQLEGLQNVEQKMRHFVRFFKKKGDIRATVTEETSSQDSSNRLSVPTLEVPTSPKYHFSALVLNMALEQRQMESAAWGEGLKYLK